MFVADSWRLQPSAECLSFLLWGIYVHWRHTHLIGLAFCLFLICYMKCFRNGLTFWGTYQSNWLSSKTINVLNYKTNKLESCKKSNNCHLSYVCYVRTPRRVTSSVALPSPISVHGGRNPPWYFGRTVGAQYGKNKRLLQSIIKGREDERWATFIEKAISHKIPPRLRFTIEPFNGTEAQSNIDDSY